MIAKTSIEHARAFESDRAFYHSHKKKTCIHLSIKAQVYMEKQCVVDTEYYYIYHKFILGTSDCSSSGIAHKK